VSRWNATGQQYAEFILDQFVLLGSVDALPDAEPLVLFRGDSGQVADCEFNPKGGWLATADVAGLALWPLSREHPIVIRRHEQPIRDLVFAPNGGWMVSSSLDGKVRLWPLEGAPPEGGRELAYGESLAVSPDGERLVVGRGGGGPAMLSPHGGPLKVLQGFTGQVVGVAFSSDGSLVAATGGLFDPTEQVIRVWKVDSGDEVAVLEVGEKTKPVSLQFTNDGRLLSMSESGLLRWDVNTGTRELVYEAKLSVFSSDARGRIVVVVESESSHILAPGSAILLNLDAGIATRLEDFGNDVISVALDPTGSLLVTGDEDGEVRVGSPNGRTPHLLLGHEGTVLAVAVDPLGRWIVSGGHDGTIRLWPMPDLSKPPLHTLPREELIAKLKTLTNLRVVRDPGSSTGWTLTHDPFPGWETVPTW
jgi:WD40 repeat protein